MSKRFNNLSKLVNTRVVLEKEEPKENISLKEEAETISSKELEIFGITGVLSDFENSDTDIILSLDNKDKIVEQYSILDIPEEKFIQWINQVFPIKKLPTLEQINTPERRTAIFNQIVLYYEQQSKFNRKPDKEYLEPLIH
ncbi:MAG: hypothetical protein AABY22_20060 [Nanoarchaeota archaeon]